MSNTIPSASVTPTSDVFALPDICQQIHRMSVETYHRMGEQGLIDEKTELIRGVVIEKMSQSPLHVFITKKVLDWLSKNLKAGWTYRPANPLTTPDSEPEPDYCVVAGEDEDFLEGHPTTAALAIEVAISSEKLDQFKADIYAESGVDEYWIVYGERRYVQVHLKPRDGKYTETKTFYPGETLTPVAVPSLSLAVDSLFPTKKSTE